MAVRGDSQNSDQRASQTVASNTDSRPNFGSSKRSRVSGRAIGDASAIPAGAGATARSPARDVAPGVLSGFEFERGCGGYEYLAWQCPPALRTRQETLARDVGSRRSRIWN